MKKFVGDISKQDAELLVRYAMSSSRILEFGVGGSTQVIAQSIPPSTTFISIDTSGEWIERTRENLRRLGVEGRCKMLLYKDWPATSGPFDFIFDDGEGSYRREFAMKTFPLLSVGGVMLFHDTRRLDYFQNVLAVMEAFFEEIEHVHLNERSSGVSSNITVIRKKKKESYVNWNIGKDAWQQGHGPVPENFWRS